ncbi:hypothetical protein TNIN_246151 [Trichonephila inaurata madagascariensis]|nr:hypothetical protein TNIN_246151 [Trichonephila inaurata madagascariensis]
MVGPVKHGGGGITVQECMAASEVGNTVASNGIKDHLYYIQILKGNLSANAEKLDIEEDYQFYPDNNPKHRTHNTRLCCSKTALESRPNQPNNQPKSRPQSA